jgi:hypothetical protein
MAGKINQINLAKLFKTVAGTLAEQKTTLNQADTYNHDHGDNMVDIFNVMAQAMQTKKSASPADQMAYASQLLRQKQSGSAQVYAQGLSQASREFQGTKKVTPDNAITLIQALMGGGQASTTPTQSGMGDLLGSLLGGGTLPQQQTQAGTGDLLGMLLGGAGTPQAGQQTQQPGAGIDVGDLVNAGMSFMNTKAQGGSTLEALVNALVTNSAMGNSPHRSQSGTLVANALLQAIGQMANNK